MYTLEMNGFKFENEMSLTGKINICRTQKKSKLSRSQNNWLLRENSGYNSDVIRNTYTLTNEWINIHHFEYIYFNYFRKL